MESRENIMPPVETIKPEALSSYQLAPSTQNGGPCQIMGPLGFSPSLAKKKRGRPRKYGPDGVGGSGVGSGRTLSPMPPSSTPLPTSGGGCSDIKLGEPRGNGGEFQAEKKKRKMNSSETKSNMSLGDQITSGGSFTPHMVTVNAGEDVTSKIISFSKYGPRVICVLSALGIISHVTLCQASSSGGTVTYEGRFEILSLSGSFTPGEEVGGISSREGGMSIALSSPDGRVVGGLLGGLLTAAGPVQVVVASFLPEVGTPIGPKPRKTKTITKFSTSITDPTLPHPTNIDQQTFNQQNPTTRNTNSTPARNFHVENHPTVPNWRRTVTDMNMSLREV